MARPLALPLLVGLALAVGRPAAAATPARTDRYGDPLPVGAVARLGTVRLRHIVRDGRGGTGVRFSPDGKVLVSTSEAHGLRAWDVATGRDLGWLPDRVPAVAVRFAPGGRELATGDTAGLVKVWQAGTGRLLRQTVVLPPLPPGGFRRSGVAGFFSGDGRLYGTWDVGGDVRVYDAGSGASLLTTKGSQRGLYCSAALSPDGKLLVVSGERNQAHLIDTATGRDLRRVEGPHLAPQLQAGFPRAQAEAVYGFAFSPDGRLLAGETKDAACLWDVATGRRVRVIAHGQGCPAFSPDGKYLACGSDEPIRLYEVASGKEVRRFEPHAGIVYDLAFSPDGRRLAAALGYVVTVWDVATGRRLHPPAGHESPVSCLAFAPDGRSLASGDSEDGRLIVWDLATGRPRHVFTGHEPGVLSVAYAPDGKRLASGDGYERGGTGGADARIRLWALPEGRLVRDFHAHVNSVQSLAFTPDGRTLASAGRDARAKVWDAATGRQVGQVRGVESAYQEVTFAPDGKALLLAQGGGLSLWRADASGNIRDLVPVGDELRMVQHAASLPGGRTVATMEFRRSAPVMVTGAVRFWDVATGRPVRSFPLGEGNPYEPGWALAPDGKTLATSGTDSQDAAVSLWDTASGKRVARLDGHTGGAPRPLAFSPDGSLLATGGRDTTILLWSVARARLGQLWSELTAGKDEHARALARQAGPAEAVSLLADQLRRAAEGEAHADRLIAQLDADTFGARERATRELADLGPAAAPALQRALAAGPSAEARHRLRDLLARLPRADEGELPRWAVLGLALLDELDTPEARRALERVARGPASSAVTRAARAALKRRTDKDSR